MATTLKFHPGWAEHFRVLRMAMPQDFDPNAPKPPEPRHPQQPPERKD